jgi:2-polyprenyl-6-methoxyphenol hydroxylase-like FAD-dependent oxidoreductase
MLECLVIGSGVGGLATALSLQKAGHTARVFEARSEPSDGAGAFLSLAVNGFDALETLGLKEQAVKLGFSTPLLSMYLGSTGRHLIDVGIGGALPDGTTARTMTRSELYTMLRTEAQNRGIRIEYGKRLTAVKEQPDGVTAVFADGTSADGALLVGADGLRSAVRPLIDGSSPAPETIPLLNTGGIIPAATAAVALKGVDLAVSPGHMKMVFGRRCFYCYMLSPDGRIWWFANPLQRAGSDPARLGPVELRSWLTGLVACDRTPMDAIIATTEDIIKPYSTFDFPSIPSWHRGRMVLVGDAAHAASPSSGQGASMAIEDAVTLGRALRGATAGNDSLESITDRFEGYEAERRPRAEAVVAWGRRSSEPKVRSQFTRVFQDLAMRAVFRGMARKTADSFDWLYAHHIAWD